MADGDAHEMMVTLDPDLVARVIAEAMKAPMMARPMATVWMGAGGSSCGNAGCGECCDSGRSDDEIFEHGRLLLGGEKYHSS